MTQAPLNRKNLWRNRHGNGQAGYKARAGVIHSGRREFRGIHCEAILPQNKLWFTGKEITQGKNIIALSDN